MFSDLLDVQKTRRQFLFYCLIKKLSVVENSTKVGFNSGENGFSICSYSLLLFKFWTLEEQRFEYNWTLYGIKMFWELNLHSDGKQWTANDIIDISSLISLRNWYIWLNVLRVLFLSWQYSHSLPLLVLIIHWSSSVLISLCQRS